MVKNFRYILEALFVGCFARLIPALPLSWIRAVAWLAGSMLFYLDRHGRHVALENLQCALGDRYSEKERRQIARRSLQVFARSFLELFWMPNLSRPANRRLVTLQDQEFIPARLASKRSMITITPHFGNFEWGSANFALQGLTGVVLTQRFKNDRLTTIFSQARGSCGHEIVTQERSMVRFLKAVRRNLPVGILTDLTVKLDHPAVIIDAFGMKMRVTLLHAFLHDRTRVGIQPFITFPRGDGGYIVQTPPELHFPPGTSLQVICQGCWDVFEPLIRENPEQWLWVYKHWRYKPSNTERLYPFYANPSKQFDRELDEQTATDQ
jgi:Kdo2-lipid IVA lauroyltransferase/acyltransferase